MKKRVLYKPRDMTYFAVLYWAYIMVDWYNQYDRIIKDFLISSLMPGHFHDYPSAREVTLQNMGKFDWDPTMEKPK